MRTNLPVHLTAFVGRQRELASLGEVISRARLVTLTGVGGSGKTRLALRLAETQQQNYPGGTWFVELAPVIDGALLVQTVMTRLLMTEPADESESIQALTNMLSDRCALIVLDSCEHLIDRCAYFVEQLLRACPELTIVATSQEALRVEGEVAWRVPSLTLAPEDSGAPASRVLESDAVQLFIDRARLVEPEFTVNDRNAAAVSKICRRLDGLPLAIELAAATTRVMPVDEILGRLEDRFRFLTGGARTAVPRHQTLRAAVQWSYGRLNETEQRVFRRLSVFNGGFDLDAVEAVVATPPIESTALLPMLMHIADKSLLAVDESPDGRARFRLLETLRQFGLERLDELDADVRRRHAVHYLRIATEAEPYLQTGTQDVWLNRLALEQDNIRAALAWSLTADPPLALRLAATVGRFWTIRGHLREGQGWLKRALDATDAVDPVRAKALSTTAWLTYKLGMVDAAEAMAHEALGFGTEHGDRQLQATALNVLGVIREHRGDHEGAAAHLSSCAAIRAEIGDRRGLAAALNNVAMALQTAGRIDDALSQARQGLAIVREVGDRYALAMTLDTVARIALDAGRAGEARDRVRQILEVAPLIGDTISIANGLEGAAQLAATQGMHERTVTLAGAASAVRDRVGTYLPRHRTARLQATIAECREKLGPTAGAAWDSGTHMTADQAVALALTTIGQMPDGDGRRHETLSAREVQVAALIASGLSNKEIAGKLGIAVRTADAHVEHIRNKLGVHSRAQIASWATANLS